MIVTRSWLEEFIDLKNTTDDQLFGLFNSIGLEVGAMHRVTAPEKIVIGEIISCEKHLDADKLNVCKVDIGSGIRQIVCGASNVVDALYVAVATINTIMPDGLEIKPTTLRGIDSEGMICSSSELGFAKLNDGIMLIDDSIGEIIIGKELREYHAFSDTIFELELTPNRGDCLSIIGVARDLAVMLNQKPKEIKSQKNTKKPKVGISKDASLHVDGDVNASLEYMLSCKSDNTILNTPLLIALRLATISKLTTNAIDAICKYAIHSTGVILRCFDAQYFKDGKDILDIHISKNNNTISLVDNKKEIASDIGIYQSQKSMPTTDTQRTMIEASYIDPIYLHEINDKQNKDETYYMTSRGSNPNLELGMIYISNLLEKYLHLEFHEGTLSYKHDSSIKTIIVDLNELFSIIGQDIEKSHVSQILNNLEFSLSTIKGNSFVATVPPFRHDIENIQDIAEEILRITGINNINPKHLVFKEVVHSQSAISDFRNKNSIRHQSIANGFDEALTYMFSDQELLKKYGFEITEAKLSLLNPIVKELDGLRSTILINLLLAIQKNINYGQRAVGLFEIGSVFSKNRNEIEKISFVWSGQKEREGIANNGKPHNMTLPIFLQKIQQSIGHFELQPCSQNNGLIHPYQSADIVSNGNICGYISKLHPTVQDDFGLSDTFIAEIEIKPIYDAHINANAISNFQGTYKDLSLVINKNIPYCNIKKSINDLGIKNLKNFYPVDIYEDSTLQDKQSLTIRFFIQSNDGTLNDTEIESVTSNIIDSLSRDYGASLR